ncbi:LamB/YcsF family protein, partial [Campylobacter jejuni]|uniref:LamB/YcsF family protein n=1 Tax=Campylobacter jejuni TaxID=197 RepID=UPI0022428B06
NYALYQLRALIGFAKAKGMKIQHFKAHGALYNMEAIDENLDLALCEAVASFYENIIFIEEINSSMRSE